MHTTWPPAWRSPSSDCVHRRRRRTTGSSCFAVAAALTRRSRERAWTRQTLAFERAAELYRLAMLHADQTANRAAISVGPAEALANAGHGAEAGTAFEAAARLHAERDPHAVDVLELRRKGAEQLLRCGQIEGVARIREVLQERLRVAAKSAATMEKTALPPAAGLAACLRAGLAAAEGDGAKTRRLLGEARTAYEAADMRMHAAAAAWWLGRDGQDRSAAERADSCAGIEGCRDLERLSRSLIPLPTL